MYISFGQGKHLKERYWMKRAREGGALWFWAEMIASFKVGACFLWQGSRRCWQPRVLERRLRLCAVLPAETWALRFAKRIKSIRCSTAQWHQWKETLGGNSNWGLASWFCWLMGLLWTSDPRQPAVELIHRFYTYTYLDTFTYHYTISHTHTVNIYIYKSKIQCKWMHTFEYLYYLYKYMCVYPHTYIYIYIYMYNIYIYMHASPNHVHIETCVDRADRGKPWSHQGASGKRYLVGRFPLFLGRV